MCLGSRGSSSGRAGDAVLLPSQLTAHKVPVYKFITLFMQICRKTNLVNSLLTKFIAYTVLHAHLPQNEISQLTAQKVYNAHCS